MLGYFAAFVFGAGITVWREIFRSLAKSSGVPSVGENARQLRPDAIWRALLLCYGLMPMLASENTVALIFGLAAGIITSFDRSSVISLTSCQRSLGLPLKKPCLEQPRTPLLPNNLVGQ